MLRTSFVCLGLLLFACASSLPADEAVLFDFSAPESAAQWKPYTLTQLPKAEPAPASPTVEHVPASAARSAQLKIVFSGGVWPTVATTSVPVTGNWREFQSLRFDLTVDRPCVAYMRIHQKKADDKGEPGHWAT